MDIWNVLLSYADASPLHNGVSLPKSKDHRHCGTHWVYSLLVNRGSRIVPPICPVCKDIEVELGRAHSGGEVAQGYLNS